ncbi:MAG: phage baseplate assembly protein V [Pseudoxanthomonas sp.]
MKVAMATHCSGKSRGTVVDTMDPQGIARIQNLVPDVAGRSPGLWALPCLSMRKPRHGAPGLPQVGAAVWVAFERGCIDLPLWTGGFWRDAAEVPAPSP